MIAITTSNSTSVNPFTFLFIVSPFDQSCSICQQVLGSNANRIPVILINRFAHICHRPVHAGKFERCRNHRIGGISTESSISQECRYVLRSGDLVRCDSREWLGFDQCVSIVPTSFQALLGESIKIGCRAIDMSKAILFLAAKSRSQQS